MKILSLRIASEQDFRESVYDIVNSPQYSHLKSVKNKALQGFFQKLNNWFEDLFKKAFGSSSSVAENSDVISAIFTVIAVIGIFALIIFLILRAKNNYYRRPKEILGEEIHEDTTPLSLRKQARSLGDKGELRQAIRLEYIALLLLLHENKSLYLEDSMTNYEIYLSLKKDGFYSLKDMEELMGTFNYTWYGGKECPLDRYLSFQKKSEELWNEVMTDEKKSK